jgi:hypothetical protein
MKYRIVRSFGPKVNPARPYRVETEECLSEKEAMALLRELGSPYNGRLEDDRPAPRKTPSAWLCVNCADKLCRHSGPCGVSYGYDVIPTVRCGCVQRVASW